MECVEIVSRTEWRSWLEKNHKEKIGAWLVFHKKHTGKPSIVYEDAVEEALCFGWIDSLVKKIDEEKYCRKFTPRKDKSGWSEANKKRVQKLIKQGRMTDAGLAKVTAAKNNGTWDKIIESKQNFEMPIAFKEALCVHQGAKDFYDRLPPSDQNQYVGWIASAKKNETRERRINEAVRLLSKRQKLGMK